jgi:hypothetical protein
MSSNRRMTCSLDTLSAKVMNTLSPVISDALRLLRQDLYLHLDNAEFLAARYDAWSEKDVESARALIQDLVTVIRGVVALHDSTSGAGHCTVCDGIWPCKAFETVHRLVKAPDTEFVKIIRELDEA